MVREAGADSRTEDENGTRLTPVMRQYREAKEQHPDTIVFFRIGDFYETFEADAELVSRELEIVLTSRSRSGDNRIPLAGVPYHAVDGYIAKLIGKGYRVAICEQVEDPKTAKGIVKREIVRVITPGTVIDSALVPSVAATYLMAASPDAKLQEWGIALLDISTGEFFAATTAHDPGLEGLRSEIARYRPAECIVPASLPEPARQRIRDTGVVVTVCRDELFGEDRARQHLCGHFHVASLGGFGFDGAACATGAAGAALAYAQETQHATLPHISGLSMRTSGQSLVLDAVTLRNLEVRESIRAGTKGATLFASLDLTLTPMGSRLLNSHLTRPLTDIAAINHRLDAVEFLAGKTAARLSLRDQLKSCGDIERIAARIAYGNAGPRDLVALAETLAALPGLRQCVTEINNAGQPALVSEALAGIRDLPEVIDLIGRAITDDPPAIARNGGVIRTGYSGELDSIRGVLHSGKDWIVELQEKEREATGIKSLKIGYNRIFGYYIDVTKPNVPLVPPRYERKQTTATGERYTIPELREKEVLITNADERVLILERELYSQLLDTLRKSIPAFQSIANGIAVLDVAAALAEVAQVRNYVRPQLDDSDTITIRDGRHPVVEQGVAGGFIPNDTELSGSATQIMIITGANMAGKSTYMRATALICIMAQAGSFVPARHARIGVLDRIFTRVGAFDDLASGQSTFFVEMLELANILNNVTPRSLVILDEIGRGTSTADGSSIARAVLEYLHGKSGAGPKTLFATHFHELIAMEEHLKRVKNYHFAVKETKDEVVFLRKIIPGATDKSYGIHVARLAGIPKKVTERAEALLDENMNGPVKGGTRPQRYTQILLVDDQAKAPADTPHPVLEELGNMNPDEMTPLQALSKITELKRNLEGNGSNG
ncbi:MAG: DNA mismatch repair protein MutS [Methanoregula sp.]|jgi:DNA mismatch repair protein MutS|uniref:DNA mismatch repair protein MutS n=1 Tax=Methanoregula sp. TaxID=2052170 RepID=UPI0025D54A0A|nr:DNA mismatch repair protein MutS [Methanoregula sp.]MCK9630966.1 DNA mismatch repair protein MutS [Methanoregula sp.]